MTTKQIDYCIELARTLNFSRAAENMFVSQPTFSYQIKLLEEEIGFALFDRNGKGASLTPAGAQFVTYLAGMRQEMKRAIEQGQNFSAKYQDNITISLMVRQAVYFLPEAMRLFEEQEPGVQITPVFQYEGGMESFLKEESDILFALKEQARQVAGITVHDLFESRIYLIAERDDPLTLKNIITEKEVTRTGSHTPAAAAPGYTLSQRHSPPPGNRSVCALFFRAVRYTSLPGPSSLPFCSPYKPRIYHNRTSHMYLPSDSFHADRSQKKPVQRQGRK